MSTIKTAYAASTALTITLASLATSSTFVAGREATAVDNTSNLYDDVLLAGLITVGTSPAAGTQILVYVLAERDDTPTWPDVFTGSDAGATLTSVGVGQGFLRLAAALNVDSTTNSRGYPFGPISVAALFGGVLPAKWSVFVTHNTGANLHATAGNHAIKATGVTYTVT